MTNLRRVEFEVLGIPQPKGSMKSFVLKRPGQKPRAIVTNANRNTKAWELLVRFEAQQAWRERDLFLGPVAIGITFTFPRPVGLAKRVRHHVTRPDTDKLARSVLDALTGIAYLDDKQVVDLLARKRYATSATEGPRVRIIVEDAAEPGLFDSVLGALASDVMAKRL